MIKYISVIIGINIFCVINSCTQESKTIEYGQIIGNTYQNKQFDLSINIPEGWYYLDKNRTSILAKKNVEKIFQESDYSEEYVQTTLEHVALIFTSFKFRPDTIIEVNPNITIAVTNISEYPKLKDINYAIEQAKSGIKEINGNFTFGDEIVKIIINEREFKGYKSSITYNNMTANYESYLSNYGDFNLQITISFKSKLEKKELLTILKHINGFKD